MYELAGTILKYHGIVVLIIVVLLLVLAYFIIKMLVNRIMAKELSRIKSDLDIYTEKHLRAHIDKIENYRLGVDIVSEILRDLDVMQTAGQRPRNYSKRLDQLNRNASRVYGYFAIMAPQSVMDAFDNLRDHLDLVLRGTRKYRPPKVHELALHLINEIRKDIGIDQSPIEYRGKRYNKSGN